MPISLSLVYMLPHCPYFRAVRQRQRLPGPDVPHAPIRVSLPTVQSHMAHGQPVPRETKSANFLQPRLCPPPNILHFKPSLGHPGATPRIWMRSSHPFASCKWTNTQTHHALNTSVVYLTFDSSHSDVNGRPHRPESAAGYDWWIPSVTSREAGHVTGLTLSAGDLSLVSKLSLLRVTSLLERHCDGHVSTRIINNLAR